ncbi:MAG: hypothetical protein CMH83_23060 [Nocardioides sp.]|nr:hypothetical protein [Nocardioides sp.]
MTRRRVVLHVGMPKSGTTYLQGRLRRNAGALAEHGVTVRRRPERPGGRGGWDVVFRGALDLAGVGPGRGKDFTEGRWDLLLAHLADLEGTVVASDEAFSRADDEAVARAVEDLRAGGDADVEVVVTVRDLARTHVVTVPAVGADPGLLWRRFCRVAGVAGVDPEVAPEPPPRGNESVGPVEAQVLRLLQARLAGSGVRVVGDAAELVPTVSDALSWRDPDVVGAGPRTPRDGLGLLGRERRAQHRAHGGVALGGVDPRDERARDAEDRGVSPASTGNVPTTEVSSYRVPGAEACGKKSRPTPAASAVVPASTARTSHSVSDGAPAAAQLRSIRTSRSPSTGTSTCAAVTSRSRVPSTTVVVARRGSAGSGTPRPGLEGRRRPRPSGRRRRAGVGETVGVGQR